MYFEVRTSDGRVFNKMDLWVGGQSLKITTESITNPTFTSHTFKWLRSVPVGQGACWQENSYDSE